MLRRTDVSVAFHHAHGRLHLLLPRGGARGTTWHELDGNVATYVVRALGPVQVSGCSLWLPPLWYPTTPMATRGPRSLWCWSPYMTASLPYSRRTPYG